MMIAIVPNSNVMGKSLNEDDRDRTAEADGIAKITLENIPHIDAQLDINGLVETLFAGETLTYFLCCLFTQHRLAGIARDHPRQHKRDQQNTK